MKETVIMGVLNMTPDSFSDGDEHNTLDKAIKHVDSMCQAGADIIDVGGESSRPNATPVPINEELARTLPIIEAIHKRFNVQISIDTTKPQVMQASIASGASLINDISALSAPDALKVVSKTDCDVCIMHMQGKPQTMQKNPQYNDVVLDIKEFLKNKINQCEKAGISRNRLILDVGFGFGKTLDNNLTLLNNLGQFNDLNLPLLIGLSRKSLIDAMLGGNTKPNERVIGSISATLIALNSLQNNPNNKRNIIRTHDVGATKEALKVWYHNQLYKQQTKQ